MEPFAYEVDISLPPGAISELPPFLRRGFWVEIRLGRSLQDVLAQDCGIDPDYLRDQVQTIFLNGHPVDDLQAPVIRSGQTVALSAAMPGLVGATMRRGGYYAGLRQGISHRQENEEVSADRGWLLLKLYNFPAMELGPLILAQGIVLETAVCREIVSSLATDPGKGEADILINGQGMRSRDEALRSLVQEGLVRLRAASRDKG
jgi:hypothetical protein